MPEEPEAADWIASSGRPLYGTGGLLAAVML